MSKIAHRPLFPGTIILPMTPSKVALAETVEFYDAAEGTAFTINWQIRIGTSGLLDVCSTHHTVCITNADPSPSLGSRQETLFVLACRNAKGKTLAADITAGIWSEFSDRVVRRVDGRELTYYKSFKEESITTMDLLKTSDGNCYAWVRFFLDARRVHNIDVAASVSNFIEISPILAIEGFLLKNWEFIEPGTSSYPQYPYVNVEPLSGYITETGCQWESFQVNDMSVGDLPGQSNPHPASQFFSHAVAYVDGGNIYDVSYGVQYTGVSDMMSGIDASIQGYWKKDENAFLRGKIVYRKRVPDMQIKYEQRHY